MFQMQLITSAALGSGLKVPSLTIKSEMSEIAVYHIITDQPKSLDPIYSTLGSGDVEHSLSSKSSSPEIAVGSEFRLLELEGPMKSI
ncbi:hypothetical protein AKJ16_DCAP02850 [Drosera capensis]